MTDFGRRSGFGDMLKSVYDANKDNIIDQVIAHKLSHQAGGSDQITVAGLAGLLAAAQLSTWAQVAGKPSTFAPTAHKVSHQSAGDDQISCAALVGRINYVDRGDPTVNDWELANGTTDGDWHQLDCTGKVPAGTKFINFKVSLLDDAAGSYFQMRKNGYTDNKTAPMLRTQAANEGCHRQLLVPCDANLKVEYRTLNLTYDVISVVICGWMI